MQNEFKEDIEGEQLGRRRETRGQKTEQRRNRVEQAAEKNKMKNRALALRKKSPCVCLSVQQLAQSDLSSFSDQLKVDLSTVAFYSYSETYHYQRYTFNKANLLIKFGLQRDSLGTYKEKAAKIEAIIKKAQLPH